MKRNPRPRMRVHAPAALRRSELSDPTLDTVRLRLGGGESTLRAEAARLKVSTAELKRRLYPHLGAHS